MKVVLITGCSEGGIGFSTAEVFHQTGLCKVYASARDLTKLTSLSPGIQRIQLDVTSPSSCSLAISTILEKEGRIDILMNNAGSAGSSPVLDADVEEAKGCFEVNLFGVMRLCKLVVPGMVERSNGLIINIGSIVGNIPTPWTGVYSASKAALHSYSEVLRMEVKGFGIKVLLVAPGAITSGFGLKQLNSITQPENSLYKSVAHHILARAQISQRLDHTMPSSILATGIVKRALYSSNPTYYSAGGKAWLFAVLGWLPRWLVWIMLARALGSRDVGKKK